MARPTLEASRGVRSCDANELAHVHVEFVCTRPGHLESSVPGELGKLVAHSGAYGYCPGHAGGAHAWAPTTCLTLEELLARSG